MVGMLNKKIISHIKNYMRLFKSGMLKGFNWNFV